MASKYEFILGVKDLVSPKLGVIGTNFNTTVSSFDKAKHSLRAFNTELGGGGKMFKRFKEQWGQIPSMIAGAFAVSEVANFGREVVNTLAEFERYEAVLTNTLGSNSAAKQTLQDISDFASKTPFQVNELSDSFVKLANQNFRPTMAQMELMGDLAASTGKTFDGLTEAILDAKTMEFERLKEFGIKASKDKSKGTVTFSFKGQSTEVQATDKAIQDYLLSLGKLKGVQGSMTAISKTTGGQLSNLTDNFTQLKLEVGQALQPVISSSIVLMGNMVNKLRELTAWTQNNTGTLKVLGGAVLLLSSNFILLTAKALVTKAVMVGFRLTVFAFNTTMALARIAVLGFNGALMILQGGLAVARLAMWAFNAAVLANPLGLVVLAIASVGAGLYGLSKMFPSIGEGLQSFFDGVVYWFNKAKNYIYDVFIAPVVAGLDVVRGLLGFEEVENATITAPTIVPSRTNGVNTQEYQDAQSFDYKKAGFPWLEQNNVLAGNKGAIETSKALAPPQPVQLPNGGQATTHKQAHTGTSVMGESSSKTYQIIINNLVSGGFNVYTTNLTESKSQIKEFILRSLMEAVNDINHAT